MTTEAMQSYAQNSVLTEYQRDPEQEKALANNPEDTILLLLEGAIHKGALAIACHNSRSFTEKGFHLGRMTSIIDALRDRLDFKFNIAYDLETLYYYIDQCLQASVHETGTEQLEAAIQILNEIQELGLSQCKMPRNDSLVNRYCHSFIPLSIPLQSVVFKYIQTCKRLFLQNLLKY
ncbi:flagellar protein FliS [uncultured Thiomicrorhabdus sp.]